MIGFRKLAILLLLLGFVVSLSAQRRAEVFVLRGGNVIEGQLLRYEADSVMVVRVGDQSELRLHPADLRHDRRTSEHHLMVGRARQTRSSGIYNNIEVGLLDDGSGFDANFYYYGPGVGLSYSMGKMLRPSLGVGGGAGAYIYGGEALLPIFAEAQWTMGDRAVTPVYRLRAGYSLLLSDNEDDFGIDDYQERGGLFFNPSIGLRFPTRGGTDLILSAGYHVARYYSHYKIADYEETTRTWFRRLHFGFNIRF